MAYIGKVPTSVPLTSSDITDGIITSAKINDGSITATDMDLSGTYAFTGTVTGAGFTNDEFFAYTVASSQSISTATWTKVALASAIISNTNFNTTSYKFTVPTGKGGTWHIGLSGNWETSGDFNNCIVEIRKNDSAATVLTSNIRQEHYEHNNASKIISLSASDTLELWCRQESGSAVNFRDSGSGEPSGFMYGYRIGE